MSDIIQNGILVALLKTQNMKNIQIYLKMNLFLHTLSLELAVNAEHFYVERTSDDAIDKLFHTYIYETMQLLGPHAKIRVRKLEPYQN